MQDTPFQLIYNDIFLSRFINYVLCTNEIYSKIQIFGKIFSVIHVICE
jgi:hypothetical protein